jgi:hypothetical protein
MADDANPPPGGPDPDEARLAEISRDLADALDAAVPGWIAGLVVERVAQWSGTVDEEVERQAVAAGEAARQDVMPAIRQLLATDIDEQRTNPLAILRRATRHGHEVLVRAGVPPVERDEFSERSFPDDHHALVPAGWDEIHPDLRELGIAWGAAKAFVFKARRRADGR